MIKLKFIEVITIPTLLSTSYDKAIMLCITAQLKQPQFSIYVIIYHIIKLIMLRIHLKLKCSLNE